jgi:hypothetical protein
MGALSERLGDQPVPRHAGRRGRPALAFLIVIEAVPDAVDALGILVGDIHGAQEAAGAHIDHESARRMTGRVRFHRDGLVDARGEQPGAGVVIEAEPPQVAVEVPGIGVVRPGVAAVVHQRRRRQPPGVAQPGGHHADGPAAHGVHDQLGVPVGAAIAVAGDHVPVAVRQPGEGGPTVDITDVVLQLRMVRAHLEEHARVVPVGHIQDEVTLAAGAESPGHQVPAVGERDTAQFAVDVVGVLVGGRGQGAQPAHDHRRHVGEHLLAVNPVEGMQHAVVGTHQHHVVEEHGPGMDDVTKDTVAQAQRTARLVTLVAAIAAHEIQDRAGIAGGRPGAVVVGVRVHGGPLNVAQLIPEEGDRRALAGGDDVAVLRPTALLPVGGVDALALREGGPGTPVVVAVGRRILAHVYIRAANALFADAVLDDVTLPGAILEPGPVGKGGPAREILVLKHVGCQRPCGMGRGIHDGLRHGGAAQQHSRQERGTPRQTGQT